MKFDMHVHTNLSYDSDMSIEELLAAAKMRGLAGAAVTDHNAFKRYEKRADFFIIPSCELSTDAGHMLVLFQKEAIGDALPRDELGRFLWRDVVEAAHEQGALVFLAHPFSPKVERPDAVFREIDGIEVQNSRIVHSRIKRANEDALALAKELGVPVSAGSDAHSPQEVGTSYWECGLPESAMAQPDFEDRLKAELLSGRGRVYAGCSSPFTVLRARRRAYRRLGLKKRLLKLYLQTVKTALLRPFKRLPRAGYLNLKG